MTSSSTLFTKELPDFPFTAVQAREFGHDHYRLRRRLRAGQVRRLLRGVYARSDIPDGIELRARAAALVVTPHHVVVDRTAAWLLGIDTFAPDELQHLPEIETCARLGNAPTRRRDLRGGSRDLLPRDMMVIGGVTVTTPLRTSLDLACHLRRGEAYAALNDFARAYAVTPAALAVEIGRFRRRRGVIQARELILYVDPRLESPRESWTLLAIIDAGLPLPEPQFWVEIDGVLAYRVDFAYPSRRVCVEYDGREAHESTEAQRLHDRERRENLRREGWLVIVVRRGDFSGDRLDAWLRKLREALQNPSYSSRRW